jgi:Tol biopolymer transport system component/DNA-binding winged helix-turn-helix (wHTH) protein
MGLQSLDYQFDDVEVRRNVREVVRQGKTLALEPKAFRVLLYLIENRDRAIGKDELIEKVWDGVAVTDNALSRIVAQLRKELGDDARQPRYIQTLPTMGYRFVAQLSPSAAPPPSPRQRRWMLLAAAGILIVVAAAGAARWYSPHRSVVAPVMAHPIQLTTSRGLDLNGSFNPDGSSLAYSSNRSGHFEIYLHPVDSRGRELQVTSDGEENIDPAWSPDGSSIAFYSARRHGICVVPAMGGAVRQITRFGSQPVWSPDGQRIAFAAGGISTLSPFGLNRGMYPDIWIVAADGSGLRQLLKLASNPKFSGPHGFCWWPDGKRILLSAGYRVFLADAASGKSELLVDTEVGGQAVPAPDGQSVYYTNGSRIFRLPLSGNRQPVQVFDADTTYPVFLSISRAGNRLAFSQMAVRSELWQAQPGADPQPVFQEVGVRVLLPSFSPDGKRLAFSTSRHGSNWEIWIANPDGSGATALTDTQSSWISWNAASSGVLYKANGNSEVRRITPGGASELLLKNSFPFGAGQIAPDERSVIYEHGYPPNVWKLPFGAQARQLTFDPEFAGYPAISPDGKWIVYNVKHGEGSYAAVMDIEGGHQRQLTPAGGFEFPYSFSADDRRIASAALQDAAWNITTLDRVTGERKVLTHYTDFGSYVRSPAWRPHTEEIVYERTAVTGNVYAIDIAR